MKSLDAIRDYCLAYGRAEGRADGIDEERRNIARTLIQDGLYTFEDIARVCSIPLEQVQALAAALKP